MPIAVSQYLPMAVPFAILTVIGGINVTESARLAGDAYRTRSILLTEAVATLVAAVCGGVSQTTPYIGHPAYKAMGGRAAYTLATGLFVGLGGILGYIPFLAMILPIACLAPILIFVAFDIVGPGVPGDAAPSTRARSASRSSRPSPSSSSSSWTRRTPLLTASALEPHRVAEVMKIPLGFAQSFGVFVVLAHGFILTAMLWGAALAFLIDRRMRATAVTLGAAAALSLFGLIHSVLPTGGIYLPWSPALLGSRMPVPLGGRLRRGGVDGARARQPRSGGTAGGARIAVDDDDGGGGLRGAGARAERDRARGATRGDGRWAPAGT